MRSLDFDANLRRFKEKLKVKLVFYFITLIFIHSEKTEAQFIPGISGGADQRIFPQIFVLPRHPGKPDRRWRAFDWKYSDFIEDRADFRLHFYPEAEWTARFALSEVRSQLQDLIEEFDYSPSRRFDYVLFSSHQDFQQANLFFITEGIAGITDVREGIIAVPYWGDRQRFYHISHHEMVHQFQAEKIRDLAGPDGLRALENIPLWFIEGMAEYSSLDGVDVETRFYVRDLLLYPDEERNYTLPALFDLGPMSFVHIYKMGQVRIDFLEREFGEGTAQRIFEAAANPRTLARRLRGSQFFENVVAQTLEMPPEELQSRWDSYLDRYRDQADALSQPLSQFELIESAGERLDHFDISPDGRLAAIREVNPRTGVTSIELIDLRTDTRVKQVARDQTPGILSLNFMLLPVISLSNHWIAYIIGTPLGSELEVRAIHRTNENEVRLGRAQRQTLHKHGIIQAQAPAISPDEASIAFVGLSPEGWQNIYLLSLRRFDEEEEEPTSLTNDIYAWKGLSWGFFDDRIGLFAASDQTSHGEFNIFHIDPMAQQKRQLTTSTSRQLSPSMHEDELFFESWQSGAPQIHTFQNGQETQVTEVKTRLSDPKARDNGVYVLGFQSGRNRLLRVPRNHFLNLSVPPPIDAAQLLETAPWQPVLEDISEQAVQSHRPFLSPGARLENIVGAIGTGGSIGIIAMLTDFMRDYELVGEFFRFGEADFTTGHVFLNNRRGRNLWTSGAYRIVQPRVDAIFMDDDQIRTYFHEETGGVLALQLPLNGFQYVDINLRGGSINRTRFNDPQLREKWEERNPGREFMLSPTLRYGYDRVLFEPITGPIGGFGLLLESDSSYFPARNSLAQRFRLDGSQYFRIWGSSVLALRAITGAAFMGEFRNPFIVSSDDILRAYPFLDERLFGNYLAVAKAELGFPIGAAFGFPFLRGIAAYDYGTVAQRTDLLGKNISSSYSAGLALNIPPLAIQLLLSFAGEVAPGPALDLPIFHFTLRYLYR
jgi:hypothetical protein